MATEADAVATPSSRDELAAELRAAAEAGLPVRVRGGGHEARLGRGRPLRRRGRALDGRARRDPRAQRRRPHRGPRGRACRWPRPRRAFAEAGQMLALDPPGPGGATVGGVVAAGDSGPLRHRYGGARDLVVGMTRRARRRHRGHARAAR